MELAYITPEVIKWARKTARYSIEDAAKHLNVPVTKLNEWETGVLYPSIKQAEKLAKFYKRPFAAFFLPSVPNEFTLLKDYRHSKEFEFDTATAFIIREIEEKHFWIKDYLTSINNLSLPFIGSYNLNNDPADVAENIRETLNLGNISINNTD